MTRRLALAAAVLLAAAAPAAAETDAGAAAFAEGDFATAVAELAAPAAAGDPRAQHLMGRVYAGGRGVERDEAKAARWFRRAAEQDFAAAQLALGIAYELGRGVPTDSETAFEWILKAAEQHHAPAQFYLGAKYEEGVLVGQAFTTAHMWYSLSAVFGDRLYRQVAEAALDDLERHMTEAEIARALARVRDRLAGE